MMEIFTKKLTAEVYFRQKDSVEMSTPTPAHRFALRGR